MQTLRIVCVCVGFLSVVLSMPAETFTSLASFSGSNGEGGGPQHISLVQGTDGNYYGTTYNHGSQGAGVVFKITPGGTLTTLHSFAGYPSEGGYPYAGLVLGTDGNFYGTTQLGGANSYSTLCKTGCGTVFKIAPDGTLTTLYSFCAQTNCTDGAEPDAALVQASDGNFYGTTYYDGAHGYGTIFRITPKGALTTLYSFCTEASVCPDGGNPEGKLIQATDGNLYGTTSGYGAHGLGTVFKISLAGKLTILHSFAGSPTEGSTPYAGLVQATNGSFYGTTNGGGASGDGTVFKITSAGALTTLYSFCSQPSCADGSGPEAGVIQATDGSFYGTTYQHGANGVGGTVFKITSKNVLTTLHSFCGQPGCTDGGYATAGLLEATNGNLYGATYGGGASSLGTIFSEAVGLSPFVEIQPTSAKVGTKVGIMGQGFESSSVVKFGGVKATTFTLTGTTYIVATVPAGAVDGKVTVTTGSTTLSSTQTFIVHNSWALGKAIPTPVAFASAGVLNGEIYLVGGYPGTGYSGAVGDNQIYNPVTNTWSSGAALPTGTAQAAAAVVNNVLYVFGGSNDGGPTVFNSVWAYNPKTKAWASKSTMPTARCSLAATVEKSIIYVIGGYANGLRLSNVEAYDPATDSWTEEAPLAVGKSEPSVGLVGSTILATDGYDGSLDNGDNEGYNVATNKWTSLKADPNPRNAACGGAIGSQMYVAGGGNVNGPALNSTESFTLSGNAWSSLDSMRLDAVAPGSAVYSGQLYCIGGWASSPDGTLLSAVQIYQP